MTDIESLKAAVSEHGSVAAAARALKIPRSTLRERLDAASRAAVEGSDRELSAGEIQKIVAAIDATRRERQRSDIKAGIEGARGRGVTLGRPRVKPIEGVQVSVRDAAKLWGCSKSQAARRLDRGEFPPGVEKIQTTEPEMPQERESFHSGRRLPQTADDCWALLDDFIGRSRRPAPKRGTITPKKGAERVVIASDFHAPFQDNWAVAELITRESASADTLIVNGDLQDFYAISRFTKYERVSVESELAAVDALLGQLSAAFREVVLVSGNHDHHRFEKQLRALLSPEMVHVIEFLTGGNMSVLRLMAKRYPNVTIAETKVGRFGVGWLYQHGDVICTHAEKYSRVPGSALRGIDEWLTDFDQVLGLDPWKVLIQAHTHAGGVFPFKADRLLVECGAMCMTHGYQLTARIMGRPQRIGYVTLEQEQGKTAINSVRFVWLDAERKVA